ncbi:hypothetical protein Ahy_A10g049781 isoform A [Arachis hypogaea]|uniref:Trafficking protein particle complex subunit n=1 Tax=Arachis hypogaea TaxID=3818 RepID=A0A445B7W6_ARAHY|nr:hypothetical protein Ahy_A10g049781 isoform A [Arachis hypogaea]
MLLHDSRNDDGIKSFFQDVHELYIKTLLNPLYLPGSRITSSHFDTKSPSASSYSSESGSDPYLVRLSLLLPTIFDSKGESK